MPLLSDRAVLNVVVDEESFRRIEDGKQKVVFEDISRRYAIERWWDKGKELVIKVWCDARKRGNRNASFECICIWDSDYGSWLGWLPDDQSYEQFGEPAGDHFVLYLGERV